MNIGDKVRFLHEVGGGVVSGFQGKNIVLVEDEDGFEIPMPVSEVVVVNADNYNMPKVDKKASKAKVEQAKMEGAVSTKADDAYTSVKAQLAASLDAEEDDDVEPCDRPVTFKAAPLERKGGDSLNLSLCFVPTDVKRISSTDFNTYLVNDSNYFMQVLYMNAEGERWNILYNGVVRPNSRVLVDNFDHSVLNEMEYLCLQTLAWKEDKAFDLKPALTTEIKLDCTKFYKLHVFQRNEHFDTPVWEVPVLRDDKSVRALFVDADALQEAMNNPAQSASQTSVEPKVTLSALGREKSKAAGAGKPKGGKSMGGTRPKQGEIIEVDLHIANLLDTAAGLSNADMLLVQMQEFRRVMDENLKRPGQKIVFIHGKGDGVLRRNLLQELKYRYKQCTWQDASFREYGYGATQVTIHNA
ncbi:MAG: DUF2027 domain-containing protein [Bacteroidales bacterium]|nr:DUF2027 domain-containing protein [Bacteroidales bacterium]